MISFEEQKKKVLQMAMVFTRRHLTYWQDDLTMEIFSFDKLESKLDAVPEITPYIYNCYSLDRDGSRMIIYIDVDDDGQKKLKVALSIYKDHLFARYIGDTKYYTDVFYSDGTQENIEIDLEKENIDDFMAGLELLDDIRRYNKMLDKILTQSKLKYNMMQDFND